MADFDFTGASNTPDDGGVGAPPAPPPSGIPSVAATPDVVAPPVPQDPRLTAALAALQPKPQPTGWQAAIQKIAPLLGAVVAMHQNAGGAFANAYQQSQLAQQDLADREAQRNLRLADVLHQIQQEKQAAANTQARLDAAKIKADAQAQQEQQAKADKLMRDEWTAQSNGGLIDTINNLIQTQGQDAANQYMASTTIGSLKDAGLPHTVKYLVDKYAVRAPDGTLIGGKTKTPKEVAAGSKEEYVLRARDMAQKTLGRPLTDDEERLSDEKALKRYSDITKDDGQDKILKGLQIDAERLRIEGLQRQADQALTEKYGSTPIWMQDGVGNVHTYFVKKGEKGQPPSLFELKNPGLPPDLTRLQPPDKFDRFLQDIGIKDRPTIKVIGGGIAPTDPNFQPN